MELLAKHAANALRIVELVSRLQQEPSQEEVDELTGLLMNLSSTFKRKETLQPAHEALLKFALMNFRQFYADPIVGGSPSRMVWRGWRDQDPCEAWGEKIPEGLIVTWDLMVYLLHRDRIGLELHLKLSPQLLELATQLKRATAKGKRRKPDGIQHIWDLRHEVLLGRIHSAGMLD